VKTDWQQPPPAQGRAADVFKHGALYTTKDLACAMLCHPRTVKRWWKKLNVPPFAGKHGAHRWTYRQCLTLINRWKSYQSTHRAADGWRDGKKYPV
jgi:hypothetical protein